MIGVPWCTGRNDDDEYAVVARLTQNRGAPEETTMMSMLL
jgi:hypothetical protein